MRIWETSGGDYDLKRSFIAVISIGSVERHGDHLPLGTDVIEASYVAEKIAERINADLFPPIWYGSTRAMRKFNGTIDIDPDVLFLYLKNVLKEIARNGYRYIVVVNGHGGNSDIIRTAAREVSQEIDTNIIIIDWWRDLAQEDRYKIFKAPGHAGEDETSVMLYIAPHTVNMSYAKTHIEKPLPLQVYSKKYDSILYPYALLGDATSGDPEKGRIWLEKVVEDGVRKIREIIDSLEKKRS